jgi:hypothetical protein
MHKFLAQTPFLYGFTSVVFLGSSSGREAKVTQNRLHLSGHKQFLTDLPLLQIVDLYVRHSNCMCQTSCIVDDSVTVCTSQYVVLVKWFVLS